jgi:hypothetical protein
MGERNTISDWVGAPYSQEKSSGRYTIGVEFETIISLDEGVAWFTGVTELSRKND